MNNQHSQDNHDLTMRLNAWRAGQHESFNEIIQCSYQKLLSLSKNLIHRNNADQWISAHDLLHDSFFRIKHLSQINWMDRMHFYHVCAKVMRYVLLDRIRCNQNWKNGGGIHFESFQEELHFSTDDQEENCANIFSQLGTYKKHLELVLHFRYLLGYSNEQICRKLGISESKLKSYIKEAHAWIQNTYFD